MATQINSRDLSYLKDTKQIISVFKDREGPLRTWTTVSSFVILNHSPSLPPVVMELDVAPKDH